MITFNPQYYRGANLNVSGVEFANFQSRLCDKSSINDFAISSNPMAVDLSHPVHISNVTIDPSVKNKVYYHQYR